MARPSSGYRLSAAATLTNEPALLDSAAVSVQQRQRVSGRDRERAVSEASCGRGGEVPRETLGFRPRVRSPPFVLSLPDVEQWNASDRAQATRAVHRRYVEHESLRRAERRGARDVRRPKSPRRARAEGRTRSGDPSRDRGWNLIGRSLARPRTRLDLVDPSCASRHDPRPPPSARPAAALGGRASGRARRGASGRRFSRPRAALGGRTGRNRLTAAGGAASDAALVMRGCLRARGPRCWSWRPRLTGC